MKVSLAFQLLSRRMASAIRLAGEDTEAGLCSKTWQASADFVEEMDAVIDACNTLRLNSMNKLKRPLSDKNPEIQQRLENFTEWSKNWVIKRKGNDCASLFLWVSYDCSGFGQSVLGNENLIS